MKTKLCKPILVETNKETNLILSAFGTLYLTPPMEVKSSDKYQELILISLDPEEKIQVGDTVLRPDGVIVTMSHSDMIAYLDSQSKATKKVIAYQSHLPQKYIQQFIEQYNKGKVDDVEIEMEDFWASVSYSLDVAYRPKLINNQIQIVEKKSIPYTEEEVEQLIHSICGEMYKKGIIYGPLAANKWFEQNKKK